MRRKLLRLPGRPFYPDAARNILPYPLFPEMDNDFTPRFIFTLEQAQSMGGATLEAIWRPGNYPTLFSGSLTEMTEYPE